MSVKTSGKISAYVIICYDIKQASSVLPTAITNAHKLLSMLSSDTSQISAVIKNVRSELRMFKIKLAPLKVPGHRRLETLAAFAWIMMPFFLGPICWATLIYLIAHTTTFRYLALAYLMWMYMDKETCERGGRRWDWFRKLGWWQHYRNYFPVHLVATQPLSPDRNYLFACYPHGILSSGAFSAFGTDAHNLESIIPGIKPYVCTLKINFDMPLVREAGLAAGLCAASRESLNWILGSPGKGRAAVLVVGGAAEALYSAPGIYKIVLKHRKGFCKIALQNGSPLVPVFSFGEIDLYNQYLGTKGSLVDRFQKWIKKKTGIVPIVFFGRGVFNYSFGLVPKRRPVTVVVGKPIEVESVKDPTPDQVNALHKKFTESIVQLFNEEKHKYLEDPDTELLID